MNKHKLGLVSVSFRPNTPEEIFKSCKNAGLECIEWGSDIHAPCKDFDKLNEINRLKNEYGIECSSYGTYFRIGENDVSEIKDYIKSAKILGTDILRLWCGNKNSQLYTEEEKTKLFDECRKLAKIAEENQVILCMECHNNTYTNKKESALELMENVNSKNFRMYWQPNQFVSFEENIAYAKLIAPYTVYLHVFNWEGKEKFPLEDGKDKWKEYLKYFKDDITLLLEFMPDNKIESLETESKSLYEIANA